MEAVGLLSELKTMLAGRSVTFIRLAANSLLLYVDCAPGEKTGYVIWFEPTWHVSGPKGVLVGSRQAQGDSAGGASAEELDALLVLLHQLRDQPISQVGVDERTHDVCLEIEGGYLIKTFVADPRDEEIWHIQDRQRGLTLQASPSGWTVRHSPA